MGQEPGRENQEDRRTTNGPRCSEAIRFRALGLTRFIFLKARARTQSQPQKEGGHESANSRRIGPHYEAENATLQLSAGTPISSWSSRDAACFGNNASLI